MVFAASFSQSIAFEFQEQGKFTGIIGKAYITETTIEIVTFAEIGEMVVPYAFIDTILEKRNQIEGLYGITCRNQLGVVSTGTLDIRDPLKPKITLTTDKGITITNISDGGRKMKKKLLPNVDLGK
jgi:phage head maturation protease